MPGWTELAVRILQITDDITDRILRSHRFVAQPRLLLVERRAVARLRNILTALPAITNLAPRRDVLAQGVAEAGAWVARTPRMRFARVAPAELRRDPTQAIQLHATLGLLARRRRDARIVVDTRFLVCPRTSRERERQHKREGLHGVTSIVPIDGSCMSTDSDTGDVPLAVERARAAARMMASTRPPSVCRESGDRGRG
jgi:hypothetical protein